jgi:hypothetical protein
VLKPLQRLLHNDLRRHPTFKLVGETVTVRLVDRMFSKFLYKSHFFISGDYTDATNCLDSRISVAIGSAISATIGLGEGMSRLFIESLTQHILKREVSFDCPEGTYVRREEFLQKNGQLMGSVTSFIVLCIANAAICGLALEEGHYSSTELHRLPLLINGDDCLFYGNNNIYEIWKILGKISGLEPSLGKVFRSKNFLQINSMNFKLVPTYVNYYLVNPDSEWPDARPYYCNFKKVPTLLLRAVEGMSRSTALDVADDKFAAISSLRSRQDACLLEAPKELRQKVNSFFWKKNRVLIQDSGLPWYVPREFGGLDMLPEDLNAQQEVSKLDSMIISGLQNGGFKRCLRCPVYLNPESRWTIQGRKNHLLRDIGLEMSWRDYEQLVLPEFDSAMSMAVLFLSDFNQICRNDNEFDQELVFQDTLKRNQNFWRLAHNQKFWEKPNVFHVSFNRDKVFPHLSGLCGPQGEFENQRTSYGPVF